MSYIERFGDGFDFNNLGRSIGLRGFKPMRRHFEDSIGLHGFNAAGKAHGTNALGGALILGGHQLMSYLGTPGVAESSGGSGGFFDGFQMKDVKRVYDAYKLMNSLGGGRGTQTSPQPQYQNQYQNQYQYPEQSAPQQSQFGLPGIMNMVSGFSPVGMLGMLARM